MRRASTRPRRSSRANRLPDLSALAGATIAFDLDGALVDTAPDILGALNRLLTREGLPPVSAEEPAAYIGHGVGYAVERVFHRAGAVLEQARLPGLVAAFREDYLAHIADESRPYPGCLEALGTLRDARARLCVCTNKQTYLSRALLDRLGMSSCFDAVVGQDLAPAGKPDPRHLEAAVAAAGGDLRRAIMVGDAAPDAGAARAAGVPLILVSFGYSDRPPADLEPDILIDHFDELPSACARLLAACGS
jgi:phosphoglycolate phosphatase